MMESLQVIVNFPQECYIIIFLRHHKKLGKPIRETYVTAKCVRELWKK